MKRAIAVALRRLVSLGEPIQASPPTDDLLDMLGGACLTDGEQSLLGLCRGHARQRADLGVRQLAASESLPEQWQRSEGAGHADVLTRGAGLEPDAPGEPVRARAEAMAPAAARVELADEIEQPRGGRIEVGRKLGGLVTETLQLDGVRIGRDDVWTIDAHRRVSAVVLAPTLHRDFRGLGTLPGGAITCESRFFRETLSRTRLRLSARRRTRVVHRLRRAARRAEMNLSRVQN